VTEAAMIWPAALALPVWRSALKRPWNRIAAAAMLTVSAAAWALRLW